MDQGDERRSLRPCLISAEKISKSVKAKPLQPCGLAAITRQTASKAAGLNDRFAESVLKSSPGSFSTESAQLRRDGAHPGRSRNVGRFSEADIWSAHAFDQHVPRDQTALAVERHGQACWWGDQQRRNRMGSSCLRIGCSTRTQGGLCAPPRSVNLHHSRGRYPFRASDGFAKKFTYAPARAIYCSRLVWHWAGPCG